MEDTLIRFLLYLNDKGLINNHDFDYEQQARIFIKKQRKKEEGEKTIINCKSISGKELKALNKAIAKQGKYNNDNIL